MQKVMFCHVKGNLSPHKVLPFDRHWIKYFYLEFNEFVQISNNHCVTLFAYI